MTAKEKAKELFEKYKNIKINNTYLYPSDSYCKQCALICVDEILEFHDRIYVKYWKEVKEEINKI